MQPVRSSLPLMLPLVGTLDPYGVVGRGRRVVVWPSSFVASTDVLHHSEQS